MDEFDQFLADTLLGPEKKEQPAAGLPQAQPRNPVPEQATGSLEALFADSVPAPSVSVPQQVSTGGDPFADYLNNLEFETDRNDSTGFWPALKTGAKMAYNSMVQIPAWKLAQGVEGLVRTVSPELADAMAADTEGFMRGSAGELNDVVHMAKSIQAAPLSETMQKLGKEDSWGGFYDTFMDSPEKWTVVKELVGLSLPSSLGLAAGAYYRGLSGAFAGSFVTDWGNSYMESKMEGKSEGEALAAGTVKALFQAGIDTTTLHVSSAIDLGGKIKNILAQATAQSIGGGLAEWGKHVAVGEDTTIGQIGLEMAGEFALGPLEVFAKNQGDKKQAVLDDLKKLYEDKLRLDKNEAYAAAALDALNRLDAELASVKVPELGASGIGTLMGVPGDRLDAAIEGTFTQRSDAAPDIREAWSKIADPSVISVVAPDGTVKALNDPELLLEPGKVYAAPDIRTMEGKRDALKQIYDAELAQLQAMEALEIASPGSTNPDAVQSLFNRVDDIEGDLTFFNLEIERQTAAYERVKAFVEEMNRALGYTGNFLITFGHTVKESQSWARPMSPIHRGSNIAGFAETIPATNTTVLGFNPEHIHQSDGTLDPEFIETVVHEYGHAFMLDKFMSLEKTQQNAVVASYRKWLSKIAKKELTYFDFIKEARGKMATAFYDKMPEVDKKVPFYDIVYRLDWIYQLGMNEFLARQFEKLASEPGTVDAAIRKAFSKDLDAFRQIQQTYNESFPGTMKDFKTFMKQQAASNEYAALKKNLSEASLRRVEKFASHYAGRNIKNIVRKIVKGDWSKDYEGSLDKYNIFYDLAAGLTHLTQDNPHIKGLQHYTQAVKNWWNDKMKKTSEANEVLKAWQKYVGVFNKGRKGERFAKFIFDLTVASFDSEKRLKPTDAQYIALVNKYQIDEEGMALYDMIDRQFVKALDDLRDGIAGHIQRTWKDDLDGMNAQLAKLDTEMKKLYNRNFFPLTRYGKHYVHVKAKRDITINNIAYKAGETISFSTFESEGQAKTTYNKETKKKEFSVQRGRLSDFQRSIAGIPSEMLALLAERLKLTDTQKQELKLFLNERAPGQSFKKHMLDRKQTAGFSMDAMRGFANYFMHFSNHIAKIRHMHPMEDAIKQVVRTIPHIAGDASKRQQIVDHLIRHKDYILDPGNEFANLRALGFLWYLGFVPKSAVVNLTQVPMVTYPYLAARYGDGEAVKALAGAMRTFGKLWKSPDKVPVEVHQMLAELKDRGIIDESMATEMAATAEGSIINRFAPGWAQNPRAHRIIRTAAGWGSIMFQAAEKSNRRITAIAAYQLARSRGYGHEGAIDQAEHAVGNTQYEYARWNRPFFSQKKRSIFFLFWMYKTNAMYFLLKDPGNTRYLAMLFLTAGAMGLPFSDDIMDMYDWMAKKLNKQFGEDTAPINVRLELQELIKELDLNPDLVMHGASRYMFGLPMLADMVGLPLPNADMSGSISMGRMIPGIAPLFGSNADYENTFTRGAEEVGGAVLSIPIGIVKAIADDNPHMMKRIEKALPSVARNFSKALRYATEGQDVTNTGAGLTQFDMQNPMERAEVILQALGFAPTRAQIDKEKYWMTKELVQYYTLRRTMLMQDFDYARSNQDVEGQEYIRDMIREFNAEVPVKGFKISGTDLQKSVRMREKKRRLVEHGRFTPGKARALQNRVDEAFPQPSPEETAEDPYLFLEELLR